MLTIGTQTGSFTISEKRNLNEIAKGKINTWLKHRLISYHKNNIEEASVNLPRWYQVQGATL